MPVTGMIINREGRKSAMMKQIELYGQCFELYSADGGRTWSSDPRSIVAYEQRRELALAGVREAFGRMRDEIGDADPNDNQLFITGSVLQRDEFRISFF